MTNSPRSPVPSNLPPLMAPWDSLTDAQRRLCRDQAEWMALNGLASSPQALALMQDLLDRVIFPYASERKQLRPSSRLKLAGALGALLGDLFAATNQGRWLAGSTRRKAFTGRAVGEQACADVWHSLEADGLLVHVAGHTLKAFEVVKEHVPPVFRVTQELLDRAATHGVEPAAVGRHFSFLAVERKAG